jgi:hypothetical protein
MFSDTPIEHPFRHGPDPTSHQQIGTKIIETIIGGKLAEAELVGVLVGWTPSAPSQIGAECERLARKRIVLENVMRWQPRRKP